MAILERARAGLPRVHYTSAITAASEGLRRFAETSPPAVDMVTRRVQVAHPWPPPGPPVQAQPARAPAADPGGGGLLPAAAPPQPGFLLATGPTPMSGPVMAKAGALSGASVPRRNA